MVITRRDDVLAVRAKRGDSPRRCDRQHTRSHPSARPILALYCHTLAVTMCLLSGLNEAEFTEASVTVKHLRADTRLAASILALSRQHSQ